jgi:hypothetical protein
MLDICPEIYFYIGYAYNESLVTLKMAENVDDPSVVNAFSIDNVDLQLCHSAKLALAVAP